jgi:hypothetical protein
MQLVVTEEMCFPVRLLKFLAMYSCSLLCALSVEICWFLASAVALTTKQFSIPAQTGCETMVKAASAQSATLATSNLFMALSSLKVADRSPTPEKPHM